MGLDGHILDVFEWASNNGCPWNNNLCADAARNGHLDVSQWAFSNGGFIG
jgi:hypothetical protein